MKSFLKFHYFGFIIILLFGIGCQSSKQPLNKKEELKNVKPNLFLFLADDLSYQDLGIEGNRLVNTPTIDSFAKQSISFEKMYTPTAMCAPSRAALLTGLFPHRNGCHMNHGHIYEEVKTLPYYLKQLGYTVALVGKKHIRPNKNYPFDFLRRKDLEGYLKNAKPPICIFYASNDPHGPHKYDKHNPNDVIIPKKWLDTKNTRRLLSGYYADIASLDQEFDDFCKKIKNNNFYNNSITIFTSDHGFNFFAKWSCYETGLNVPFYLHANGINFRSKSIHQLTSFVDIVPTFIELAGGAPPQDLDGKSFVGLLQGKDKPNHQFIYGAHTTRGIYSGKAYPIRSITDGKWKYIRNLNHQDSFQNILTNGWNFDPTPTEGIWAEWLDILNQKGAGANWAVFYQKRPKEELYDLETDPFEMVNFADDITYKTIKENLSNQLSNWMEQQNDTGMQAELAVPLKAKDMSKVPKE